MISLKSGCSSSDRSLRKKAWNGRNQLDIDSTPPCIRAFSEQAETSENNWERANFNSLRISDFCLRVGRINNL